MTSISFGKQIPLVKCKIKDKTAGCFVPATFYELDCNDQKDLLLIKEMNDNWIYKRTILNNMEDIFSVPAAKRKHKKYSFFILKKDNGPIVGLSEVSKCGENLALEYIESEPEDKYKYVGQTMIASLVSLAKHKNYKRLYIPNPQKQAYSFYTDKCGFKPSGNTLYFPAKRAKRLKKAVENNTSSHMINLMG